MAAKGETSFDVTVTEDVTIVVTFEVKPVVKTNYSVRFDKTSTVLKAGDNDLGGITWNLTTDAGYFAVDKNTTDKGLQIGSSSKPGKNSTLSTTELTNFNKIVLSLSTASKATAYVEVYVDGVLVGEKHNLRQV